jgi:hypothetical protein
MEIRNRPIFTEMYETLGSFVPQPDSAYIYGTSTEVRSAHSDEWEATASDVAFVRIIDQAESSFRVERPDRVFDVAVRSREQLDQFLQSLGRKRLYIDMTGLEHQVWAPLIRAALDARVTTLVTYVEPLEYARNRAPKEGDIFDLSEEIKGISPLPGFASLQELGDDFCFVSLLGFEGFRFKHAVQQLEPPPNRIFPIVGVPGFRPDYPFYTYDGNRPTLIATGSWSNVRFARANCPFSLCYALDDIGSTYPSASLKIALIGTKPHALGAIIHTLMSSKPVELIYDHPKRKKARTRGAGRMLVYHISAFAAIAGRP